MGLDTEHHFKTTIPVCFNKNNLKVLEDYAKKKGMLDHNQAIEHLVKKTWEKYHSAIFLGTKHVT